MLVLDVREPSPAGTSNAARRSEKSYFPISETTTSLGNSLPLRCVTEITRTSV
jgi:hypothetical protein